MSVACAAKVCGGLLWKATLRTSPSSGQATTSSQLRHPKLLACHSRAAFEGSARSIPLLFMFLGCGSMFHCGTLFLTAWATPAQLHLAAADYSGYLLVSDCSATSAPKLQERQ